MDISDDFRDFTNTYFLANSLDGFDTATGNGTDWKTAGSPFGCTVTSRPRLAAKP